MPSPVSSPITARRIGEWALRVLSFALLVVILMRAWGRSPGQTGVEIVKQVDIARSLPRWSGTTPASIHLVLDSVLPGEERDWLAAIERSGTTVTWTAPRIVAMATTLARVPDPVGMSDLAASAPPRSVVIVHDPLGIVDSITTGENGIRLEIPGNGRRTGVSVGASTAWASSPDSIVFKHLLVEGAASWETKFTVAALAERGWRVDALTHVAPGVDVREGNPVAPDTSRYAAVVAVDSTALLVARGAGPFVRSGGGLITLRDAGGIGPGGSAPVVLERGADGDVRAFRVGEGRVIRVSYKDLWRRRMTDDDTIPDPVAAHRAWLARAVASVAYAPRIAIPSDTLADPAPLADMVDRIGARSASAGNVSPLQGEVPSSVLFGVLLISLLLELASRRLRGAR